MTVYAKKVKTTDSRFSGRSIVITSVDGQQVQRYSTPIPDSVVICNGCNNDIYPNEGYLIYLGKNQLDADAPYDIYCESCLKEYFKGCKYV